MTNFQLVDSFLGYQSNRDLTNVDARFLIPGSQNVIVNDGEKIKVRGGTSLYGAANASLYPIVRAYTWNTSTGTEIPLRTWNDKIQYAFNDTWYTLASGYSQVTFEFAPWWDNTEKIDKLIGVKGTPHIYSWSGGITTFASATANTITKQGTTTFAEERFLTTGTRQFVIGGTTYTYSGGEGTTTLTGVTPDPTLGAYTVGAVIHQAIIETSNASATGIGSTFNNSIIEVLNNQMYIGDLEKRLVYVSKNTNFLDFSFASPRLPGEGALLTLDSAPVGFVAQENDMYISAGLGEWYQTKFSLSSDLLNESLTVARLKTGPLQGAKSQGLIGKIKNSVVFISNEPTFDTLGRVEQISTPQSKPLSDPIKFDLQGYDTTNGHMIYHQNRTIITLPAEGIFLIYDHYRNYWQPPQVGYFNRLSIIDGEVHGHSSTVPETYRILDDTIHTDNGNPIHCVATFAYRNFNERAHPKKFDEYFTEGYISSNTIMDVVLKYDFGGYSSIIEKQIDGSNTALLFSTTADGSLGKNPLGSNPLGSVTDSIDNLPKFRVIHELAAVAFYEYLVEYSTNTEDAQWAILAQGPNAKLTTEGNFAIKI